MEHLKRTFATDGAQMNTDGKTRLRLCSSVPHLWQKWPLLLFWVAQSALAAELSVSVPAGVEVTGAQALVPGSQALQVTGHVGGGAVAFTELVPDAAYDIRLTLRDGRILWGVNLGWYDIDAADASAGALSDDDRKEIQEICNVPSFYDKSQVISYSGSHDRTAGLIHLLRDRDFHAGKGEVIWRAEVWFFKFQNGGWEKVNQQTRLMDRRRFPTSAEYKKAVQPIRFVPKLGGVTPAKKDQKLTVDLTSEDIEKAIPAIPETAKPDAAGETK